MATNEVHTADRHSAVTVPPKNWVGDNVPSDKHADVGIQTPTEDDKLEIDTALAFGEEWELISKGIQCRVVGEVNFTKAHVLSGMSRVLPRKFQFNTYANASSQMGKTYVVNNSADVPFNWDANNRIVINQQSFSAKSFYYQAKDDPYCLKGKIFILDEVADLSEEARAILKPMMSASEGDELNHSTVIDGKFVNLSIKAFPIFWANSATPFEDNGFQLSNRFLKLSVDESPEQTQGIIEAQFKKAQLGSFEDTHDIEMARAVCKRIMEFEPHDVIIPLASTRVIAVNEQLRNIPKLFLSVVASVAYMHNHSRPVFMSKNGPILLAAACDILEAAELWNSFASQRNNGLGGKYEDLIKLLRALKARNICGEYTVEFLTEQYPKYFPERKAIKEKRMAQILKDLCDRDIINSHRPVGERYYVYSIDDEVDEAHQIVVSLDHVEEVYDDFLRQLGDERLRAFCEGCRDAIVALHEDTSIPTAKSIDEESHSPELEQGAIDTLLRRIDSEFVYLEQLSDESKALYDAAVSLLCTGELAMHPDGHLLV